MAMVCGAMRLVIENTPAEVGELVAAYVIKRINDFKPTATRPFILGLRMLIGPS
mgnify:CR=1 FL=1